jgi:phage shock protein PspC (stress-responsive transcriptional regulator)
MNQMSALLFERSGHDRVVAGVCGGLAARLGVDATLVRLVFALLALAGGAGILLYFALWVYGEGGAPGPRRHSSQPPGPCCSSRSGCRRRP